MKNICHMTILAILLCASFAAQSADMTPMKEMMKQQVMSSCNDRGFLSCMGINKKKCASTVEKAISSCDRFFPKDMNAMDDAAMNTHGDCLKDKLVEYSGVGSSKVEACSGSAGSQQPPMNPEQAMAMMGQALQAHAEATGTDGVTLPLYKNATVMSHFANGEMEPMFDDVEQLPALVMISSDSADKIAGYYRKELKSFKEYRIENGILFMEKGPKHFDLLQHMKVYVSTPHVAIYDDAGERQIEIAYKKQ